MWRAREQFQQYTYVCTQIRPLIVRLYIIFALHDDVTFYNIMQNSIVENSDSQSVKLAKT